MFRDKSDKRENVLAYFKGKLKEKILKYDAENVKFLKISIKKLSQNKDAI